MLQNLDSLTLGLLAALLVFGLATWTFAYGDGEQGIGDDDRIGVANFICTAITMAIMAFILVMRTDVIDAIFDEKPMSGPGMLWAGLWIMGLWVFPSAMTAARRAGYREYESKQESFLA